MNGGRFMDKDKVKVVAFAVILFIAGVIMIFMPDKSKKYHDEGIEVKVTITEKYGVKTKQYYGVYEDVNGNIVQAKVIANKAGVYPGDELIGYYMPDDPTNIICYGGFGLRLVIIIIGIFLCGLSGFMFYGMIKIDREESLNE